MKIYNTKLPTKIALPVIFLLATSSRIFAVVSPPASCTAAIGSPANGGSHYMSISWSSVSGATAYQLMFSSDTITWSSIDSALVTSFSHNTGSIGNLPCYYRVRTIQSGNTSAWKSATPFPIYSACDNPALPLLTNATGNSINLTLPPESPDTNPSYTTYSIYCTTASQFVQANGTLGATEIFETRAAWGTVTVTGLALSTNYCFYAEARNHDGDIRIAPGSNISATQTFDASSSLNTSGASSLWDSPGTCTGSSEITWHSTGGCSGGSGGGCVGYTTSPGEYYGCFLRSPALNCSGLNSVTMTFDLTNSASTLGDSIYFSIWSNVSNAYYPPCVPCGTVITSINNVPGSNIKLNTTNSCQLMTVVFDLTSIPSADRSSLFFYLNPYFLESSGTPFNVLFDNIGINQPAATSCLTTLSSVSPPPVASFQASKTVLCPGDCISFTDESTNSPSKWLWTFQGATDSISTLQNPQNICYPDSGMFNVKLVVSNSGGSDSISASSDIQVNAAPPVPTITQSNDTLYCSANLSYTSYQWYRNTALISGATQYYFVIAQGGNYTVIVSNVSGCEDSAAFNPVLGLQSLFSSSAAGFQVIPNPVTDNLIIKSIAAIKNARITIRNLLGQEVYSEEFKNISNEFNLQLPVTVTSGIYIVQVADETARWTGKLVKE